MCLLLLLGWCRVVSGLLLRFLLLRWLLLPRWFLFGLRKLSSCFGTDYVVPPFTAVFPRQSRRLNLRLLLMCLLLLLGWCWVVSGLLLLFLLLRWLLLPRRFLFGLRKLSSFASSRI